MKFHNWWTTRSNLTDISLFFCSFCKLFIFLILWIFSCKLEMSKREVGRYCIAWGCSNVQLKGELSVYEAPKATRKQWVKFLQRTRVFNDSKMQNVNICSGHFLKTDFNQSQIIPFVLGHRKAPPLLDQGSIPQKTAVPFSTVFDFEKGAIYQTTNQDRISWFTHS